MNPQYPIPNPEYYEEETISLTDIILILAKRLKIIILTPAILCLITLIYVLFFTAPSYESTAKIMSSSSGGSNSQTTELAARFGISLGGSSQSYWSYSDIIYSRTLAKAMLKRKFDTDEYGPQKTLLQILTYGNEESPLVVSDTLIQAGIEGVSGMIDFQEESDGSFYKLTITAPEPIFAKDFALALIEELDSHLRTNHNKKTKETKQFVSQRIAETEAELKTAEEKLKDFKDTNRNIGSSPALQLTQQRLGREVSVLTGVFTTLKQQMEKIKIDEVRESDFVVVFEQPEVPLKPSKPNKKLMVILSAVLGLGLGIVIVFVLNFTENILGEEKEKYKNVKIIFLKNMFDLFLIKRCLRIKKCKLLSKLA